MEEEKENEEKLNGPSRFTETKLEKGVACVTCNMQQKKIYERRKA